VCKRRRICASVATTNYTLVNFFSVFAFTAAAAAATAEITWVSFERTMGLPEPQLVLARPKHRERERKREREKERKRERERERDRDRVSGGENRQAYALRPCRTRAAGFRRCLKSLDVKDRERKKDRKLKKREKVTSFVFCRIYVSSLRKKV
jgi:hypothetical protein